MKKVLLFLVVIVVSFSVSSAQKNTPARVEKLVYPGVIFGTAQNPASCFNTGIGKQAIPSYQVFSTSVLADCHYSERYRENIYSQYLRVRKRLLNHLLA